MGNTFRPPMRDETRSLHPKRNKIQNWQRIDLADIFGLQVGCREIEQIQLEAPAFTAPGHEESANGKSSSLERKL